MKSLYGTGTYITRTGRKLNFAGTSSTNPIGVEDESAKDLLAMIGANGKHVIFEVKKKKEKPKEKSEETTDVEHPVTTPPVDPVEETPGEQPIEPEENKPEETTDEVPPVVDTENTLPEAWATMKYHAKKKFAIANDYDGKDGFTEPVLDAWHKTFIKPEEVL